MVGEWRQLGGWGRRRRQNKLKPGDGHALKPFRRWQLLHRSLFFLELEGAALKGSEAEGAAVEEPERFHRGCDLRLRSQAHALRP